MDITGKTKQDKQDMQAQQIREIEQMYEGSLISVDGEPSQIQKAKLAEDGIEFQTANHEYKIIME